MTTDYIVASLPALAFDAPTTMTAQKFAEMAGDTPAGLLAKNAVWCDLETQLRNAVAEARGGAERWTRPAQGCSVYWKTRVTNAFQERDTAKREELLDKIWWDAAGELCPAASPLGEGALAAYAVRLAIALKRAKISREKGGAAFDRLTAETKGTAI
ncbi:MAG: hypothetical protein J6W80_02555 [Kiritimatiellae bacterium]|nr:hypothetical protein [Kiritimatiellia bacterium]